MKPDLQRLVAALATTGPDPKFRLRLGQVTAVAADGTCSVTVGGGSAVIPSVPVLATVSAVVGRVVWLATDGRDLFVLGPVAPYGPAYGSMRQNAAQSLGNGADVAIDWTTRTDELADGVTAGNTGLTITVPGIYLVTATVVFTANATGVRYVQLRRNGTVELEGNATAAFATTNARCQVSGPVVCAIGDVLSATAFQSSGGALNTVVAAGAGVLRAVFLGA